MMQSRPKRPIRPQGSQDPENTPQQDNQTFSADHNINDRPQTRPLQEPNVPKNITTQPKKPRQHQGRQQAHAFSCNPLNQPLHRRFHAAAVGALPGYVLQRQLSTPGARLAVTSDADLPTLVVRARPQRLRRRSPPSSEEVASRIEDTSAEHSCGHPLTTKSLQRLHQTFSDTTTPGVGASIDGDPPTLVALSRLQRLQPQRRSAATSLALAAHGQGVGTTARRVVIAARPGHLCPQNYAQQTRKMSGCRQHIQHQVFSYLGPPW
jgi:hypothetical protein